MTTHPRDLDELQRHLADRDVPCPNCGYSLRGLTAGRCPECNQELRVVVELAESHFGAYLLAPAPLLAGAGAAAIFLVFAAIMTVRHGSPGRNASFIVYGLPAIALVMLGVPTAFLLSKFARRRFRSLDAPSRMWTILGCWGLLALFVGWFLLLLMLM